MVNNSAAAVWWLTKHVQWRHVLPALAAAASVAVLAVAADTAAALAAAVAVAPDTAAALAAAVAVAVAAVVVVTAVAVAATKHATGSKPIDNKRALVALFAFQDLPAPARKAQRVDSGVGATGLSGTARKCPVKQPIGQHAQELGDHAHLPGNDTVTDA